MLKEMAEAALTDRDFEAGAAGLALTRWAQTHALTEIPKPNAKARVLVVCAAFAELFAQRFGQSPPAWTSEIGGLDTPYYLFPLARKNDEFRKELERQTPEPLRKRNLFSTRNYLRHV
jgi:hypothetical protein